MKQIKFRAYRVFEEADGSFERRIVERSTADLPEGDVLIKVHYAGLNYKDALSAYGNKGVTRNYPHTPGIDAAGEVVESRTQEYKPGAKVIVTSYDLGMNTDGGFGEYIRVPASWVVSLPEELSMRTSMQYGTAGFTAALSVHKLLNAGQEPEAGPVLVTGAAGGVGSLAVLILKKLGFKVIAGTSSLTDSKETIDKLGADDHYDSSMLNDTSGRTLLKERWAGAVDCVGGNVLATVLKACGMNGNVTTCGNIYSQELPVTVYPFILKGVSLLGITSQNTDMELRKLIWQKLAGEWQVDMDMLTHEITLVGLDKALGLFMSKKNRGRVLLRHGG